MTYDVRRLPVWLRPRTIALRRPSCVSCGFPAVRRDLTWEPTCAGCLRMFWDATDTTFVNGRWRYTAETFSEVVCREPALAVRIGANGIHPPWVSWTWARP